VDLLPTGPFFLAQSYGESILPIRSSTLLRGLAFDEVINAQQDQGAHDRHNKSGGLTFLIPTHSASQPTSKKRAGNAG
jgi:hypothetical protein